MGVAHGDRFGGAVGEPGRTGSRGKHFATDIRDVCGRLWYRRFAGSRTSVGDVALVKSPIIAKPQAEFSTCLYAVRVRRRSGLAGRLVVRPGLRCGSG